MRTIAALKAALCSVPLIRSAATCVISVATVALAAAHAHAACSQGDLTGIWRFNFDTGYSPASLPTTRQQSCLLRIKSNGIIAPRKCNAVGTGEVGEFVIHTPNTKLRMNANNCEARFLGNFSLKFDDTHHVFDDGRVSISPNKQLMLGWASYNDTPFAAVTALKRAVP